MKTAARTGNRRPQRTEAARTGSRRAQRAEDAMAGAVLTAFIGAPPFVAYAAGRLANAALSQAARTQRAGLRQVPATLLEAAPVGRPGTRHVAGTPAQWPGPDGLLRTGRVAGLGAIGWLAHQSLNRRPAA